MLKLRKNKKKLLSILLATNLILTNGMFTKGAILSVNAQENQQSQYSETTSITAMAPTQGPNITVNQGGGCGFTFPIFNGGAATFNDIKDDLALFVKQDNEWVSIDNNADSGWVYDKNFGHFWDGPGGFWFNDVKETTILKLSSKTNPNVFIEYTLYVAPLNTQLITSMAPTQGPDIQVSPAGGCGFTFPTFNGGAATFRDVKDDLALFVKQNDEWVSIDGNAESGWIYDRNFGHFFDGPGGLWFNPVDETTFVKVASKSNPNVYVEYKLIVADAPIRNSYKITNFDGRATFEADNMGALGLPLPKIDGGIAIKKEVDNFVYEVKVDGQWVNILQSDVTNFKYSANGYDKMSDANQWGYWTDYIFGLWFQPIQEDVELRIGYPLDGQKGGDIGDNYVTYKFIGNPDAPRPDVSQLGSIEIGTSEDSTIEGWDLTFQDEFNGTTLDESKWNYETGYYLNDDPGTWGWGNEELQHYTDSEDNVFVKDGNLNIVALEDPKTFPQDSNRVAPYSSGKINTKDKYKFTYGRIDFRAKLPVGPGAWPALWMLPNDNVYGTWASSGEIDIMEARGRVPSESSGALHFGGEWPLNKHISGVQTYEDGGRMDEFHTYSLIWEADQIKWYVDGKCFYAVNKEQWNSLGAQGNPYAPFDQDFYLVMNLAMGGWFDGGVKPTPDMFPSTMQVDYVRVYNGEEKVNVPVTGVELDKTSVELSAQGQTTKLTATVLPAEATNKIVTWKSSNPEVATVSTNGTVKAIADGVATITATTADGNKTVDCTVTVKIIPVPVESITLDKTDVTIGTIGKQVTLTPNIMPANATNKAITWTTSNPEVATVDSKGVVTSVKNGEATITATTVDGGKVAKATVKVNQIDLDVDGDYGVFDIKENSVSMFYKGATFAILSYKINGGGQQNVIMDINNNNAIYRINNLKTNDKVEYYFTYKLAEGGEQLSPTSTYTHNTDGLPPVPPTPTPEIELKNGTFDNGVDGWLAWSWQKGDNLISDVKVEDGKAVIPVPELKGGLETWAVQFRQRGPELKLAKDGEYKLSFEISSTVEREAEVVVQNYAYGRTLSEKIAIGPETTKFEYTFKAAADELVELNFLLGKYGEYAAHNVLIDNIVLETKNNDEENKLAAKEVDTLINALPEVITLADKEAIEAARIAYEALTEEQKVYVTSLNKLVDAEEQLLVLTTVSSVTLDKTSTSIKVGEITQLIATINPTTATNKDVVWTSSNEEIATVDSEGRVTALAKGVATITVETVEGGFKATCTITVLEPVKSVSLNQTKAKMNAESTMQLIATINSSLAFEEEVIWTSSNEKVATVDKTGKVLAIGNGSAKITVKTVDGEKTATCIVTVKK